MSASLLPNQWDILFLFFGLFWCAFTCLNSIINLFESELKLSKNKAEWLSKEALNIHEDVNCLRKYIKLINEKYTKMQKRNLINMAWLVARADNMIDKNEEHRIRKLTELLHLDHKDFIKSKISTE